MAGERRLTDEQRRLLRLIGLMPLASADDLSLVLQTPADSLHRRPGPQVACVSPATRPVQTDRRA